MLHCLCLLFPNVKTFRSGLGGNLCILNSATFCIISMSILQLLVPSFVYRSVS